VTRHYKERAIRHLEMSNHFDIAAFLDAVVKDDDIERKARLMDGLLDELDVTGVAGQRFASKS